MKTAMKVKRYNYPSQFGNDVDGLLRDLEQMLLGGRYILTEEVRDFEEAFGRYLNVPFVRGVNSGTDALILGLMVLGVGRGDEVMTQANTFHATAAAICFVGAKPVLVDAEEETFLIDQSQIEEALTERTRAIIPVHLYGKPTPMNGLLALAEKHGLKIVEDAAQAHGAEIENRRVGTIGDIGCFSFHPSKNLAAAGDAGAVVTSDERLDERIDWLRGLGQHGQNHHVVIGLNSKLDSIQARILSHKLPSLEQWNEQRRHVAALYHERLEGLPLRFQRLDSNEKHVFHLFQVRTNRRDELMNHLKANGIDPTVRYPTPIHLQPAFAEYDWRPGQFPVAEKLAEELICLPLRPDMQVDEVDYVAEHVRAFFNGSM